jgi:hypothetical protein
MPETVDGSERTNAASRVGMMSTVRAIVARTVRPEQHRR